MSPSRSCRRAVAFILVPLALGAATAVVVAFAAAAMNSVPETNVFLRPRGGERDMGKDPNGLPVLLELSAYDRGVVTFAYGRVRMCNPTPDSLEPTPESVAARWERVHLLPWRVPPTLGQYGHESIAAKAAGWPWRCAWCNIGGHDVAGGHDYVAPGGVMFKNFVKAGWADWPPDYPVIIPLRPLWPELVGDAGVFAAGWLVVLYVPRSVRRGMRRRRGACVKCGYDLRATPVGSVCPECGCADQRSAMRPS